MFAHKTQNCYKISTGTLSGYTMLQGYIPFCCPGYILLSLILWAFAGYAYRVNANRAADDPQKKDFHPAAVHFVPLTWPALIVFSLLLFVLRAFFYCIFLFLSLLAIIVIRKPFIFVWLDKIATYIGNKLLAANTLLIKLALGQPIKSPQAI